MSTSPIINNDMTLDEKLSAIEAAIKALQAAGSAMLVQK